MYLPIVELKKVSHRYATNWALLNVGFTARESEIVAILGPNGCGKSTLLKILATLLEPTICEGTILGFPLKQSEKIRAEVEWLGHELGLYKTLSAQENLEFASKLKGKKPLQQKIATVLNRVGLANFKRKPVQNFSIGMKKRLALARILLEEPKLILLDEPHTNLDKEGRNLINNLMAEWKKEGRTILFSSHEHGEALNLCDRSLTL